MDAVLVKILEQYGLVGIFIVAIGYVFIKQLSNSINNSLNKSNEKTTATIDKMAEKLSDASARQNEKMIDIMASNQKDLINAIIHQKEIVKNEHDKNLAIRRENAKKISGLLMDALNTFDCRRVLIIEFHNGTENLSGLPAEHYDVAYEEFQIGTKQISKKAKNLNAAHLHPVVTEITNNPDHVFIITPETKDDIAKRSSVLYSYISELKATAIIFAGIYNKRNRLVAILALEYEQKPIPEDINIHSINILTSTLESLLSPMHKDDPKYDLYN